MQIKIGENMATVTGAVGAGRVFDGVKRESIGISFSAQDAGFAEKLGDDIPFSFVETILPAEEGEEIREVEYDKSAFSRLEEKVIHRDGSVTVYLSKPTREELLEEENAALFFELMTGEKYT